MKQADKDKVIAALEVCQWAEYNDPDNGNQEFCPVCRNDKKYGHFDGCQVAEALTIMRGVAAEPVALKMWPHRVNHVSELGYVVWRDVFEGDMKCSLLDAVLAHKTAVFVCEDDANEYCAFINKSPQEAAISEAHAQGVREAAPKWLPIESAPKDGRTLLLGYYNSSGKWRTMRGQWFSQDMIDEEWEEPEYASEGWYETCVENDDMPTCWWTEPTHWMPLTAAPEAP